MLMLLDMSYDMPEPWCAYVRPEILRSAAAKRKQMNNLFFTLSSGRSLRGNPYFDSLYITQDLACQLPTSLYLQKRHSYGLEIRGCWLDPTEILSRAKPDGVDIPPRNPADGSETRHHTVGDRTCYRISQGLG